MSTNKVQLHRVLAAPPEKVFRAFTDPDAMASWLPPYGFIAKVYSMDVKAGGSYKMSFTNFTALSQQSGTLFLEIIPLYCWKTVQQSQLVMSLQEVITKHHF